MRITPMDIQQQKFRVRFRGFDVQEVDSFLEVVAAELKEALHENSLLRDEIKKLHERIDAQDEKEKIFQTAFVSAQKVVDEMKDNAQRQGKLVITQAEVEAERIIQRAREQSAHLQEEITRLLQQRRQMEFRVKAFINSLAGWLQAEKTADDLPEEGSFLDKNLQLRIEAANKINAAVEGVEGIPGVNKEETKIAMNSISEIISEVNVSGNNTSR